MFENNAADTLVLMGYMAHSRYSVRATQILFHTRKVMSSCVKVEQLNNAYKWAVGLIYNLYQEVNNSFFCRNLIDESEYIMALECLKETYNRKNVEIERDDLCQKDALFIQEIINDLERNGYGGGKARTMLFDWSGELGSKSDLKGQRKKAFFEKVGRENW